ncbi:hypothetical protein IHQ68_04870 [Chelatococcus sambhunathii]|uniref:Uncharacterized protein n=1 Tax=Chelatococcus sambhunathii TaxID=363953 RepID=A0ABU1DD09_9HYPH|nr:hypothetical protein [Chelatococcus sambhunathii]MDR4305957.1 hypothetical protein [Chelatococcus sambhunathii]
MFSTAPKPIPALARPVQFTGVYEAVRIARQAIFAVGGEIDDELVVTFPDEVDYQHALKLTAALGVAIGKLAELEAGLGRLN